MRCFALLIPAALGTFETFNGWCEWPKLSTTFHVTILCLPQVTRRPEQRVACYSFGEEYRKVPLKWWPGNRTRTWSLLQTLDGVCFHIENELHCVGTAASISPLGETLLGPWQQYGAGFSRSFSSRRKGTSSASLAGKHYFNVSQKRSVKLSFGKLIGGAIDNLQRRSMST